MHSDGIVGGHRHIWSSSGDCRCFISVSTGPTSFRCSGLTGQKGQHAMYCRPVEFAEPDGDECHPCRA